MHGGAPRGLLDCGRLELGARRAPAAAVRAVRGRGAARGVALRRGRARGERAALLLRRRGELVGAVRTARAQRAAAEAVRQRRCVVRS